MIKRIGDIVLVQLSDIDSNIYIVGDSAIDSGTGFNFTRLHQVLKILKKKFGDIKQVVNTHGHFDHIGGNGYFLNASCAMHELDAPILENGKIEESMADFFDGKLHARPVERKLKDGDKIQVGGMNLEVVHTPGHTPGSICLYDEKQKVIFSGDTVFADGVGRTDMPGGDPDALNASLERLSNMKIDKILPGHGDPVLSGGSKVVADMMKTGPAPE